MQDIQKLLDKGGNITLPSGEFQGSFFIRRPCTVTGNFTTLWNKNDTVLTIQSLGVTIRNLRIELSENKSAVCLRTVPEAVFQNTEIFGKVYGIKGEQDLWKLPFTASLGDFKSDTENFYSMKVRVPVDCEISCTVDDLTVAPLKLKQGLNTIALKTAPIKENVFLFGEINIKSVFVHTIYVSGKSFANSEQVLGRRIYDESLIPDIPAETLKTVLPKPKQNCLSMEYVLKKGERISIEKLIENPFSISFGCESKPDNIDLDPYIFLLDKNGIATLNKHLVFYNNPVSPCKSVKILSSSEVNVNLNTLPSDIAKLSIVYSIYPNSPDDNFSKIQNPFVKIFCNGKHMYSFKNCGLLYETTAVMLEIYRYRNIWKISASGYGYKKGLQRLCAEYGLDARM